MRPDLPPIIGQSGGENDWMKFVAPAIFFILWALSAIAGALGKQQQKRRRAEQEQREREQVRREQSAPPPVPQQQRPQPARKRRERRPIPPAMTPRPKPARQPAVAVVGEVVEGIVQPELYRVAGTPVGALSAATAGGVVRTPPKVLGQPITPRSLRRELVAAELLWPPVALRSGDRFDRP